MGNCEGVLVRYFAGIGANDLRNKRKYYSFFNLGINSMDQGVCPPQGWFFFKIH